MKFILGKKLEMTQIFQEDGNVIPATAVLVEPNVVTQIKNEIKDGYTAVQIGFGKPKNINKPQIGHLKDILQIKKMREIRVEASEIADLKRGDVISVDTFDKGDAIKVTGTSKGKGFQGVVKRHGFHGSKATHGHKDQERMPGSIGATGPQRVFKGIRMGGHMGDEQITVSGLEVVEIDAEKNILYVKGAVPGGRNGMLLIYGPGEIRVQEKVAAAEVVPEVTEEKVTEIEPAVEVKATEPIVVEANADELAIAEANADETEIKIENPENNNEIAK